MNGYMISTQDAPGIAARTRGHRRARRQRLPGLRPADGTTGILLVASDDEDGLRGAIADAGLQATALEMVTADPDNRPGTEPSCSGSSPTPASTCAPRCRSGWATTASRWRSPRRMPQD